MKTSESITKISTALLKAQAAFGVATKDGRNPHLKTSFATYPELLSVTRPHLLANGLLCLQPIGKAENGLIPVTTLLVHAESGEWMSEETHFPYMGADPQKAAAAASYAQRNAYKAFFAISIDDDDDGESAMNRTGSQTARTRGQTTPASNGATSSPATDLTHEDRMKLLGKIMQPMASEDVDRVNDYLRNEPKSGVKRGGTWKDVSPKWAAEILRNPAAFLKAVREFSESN